MTASERKAHWEHVYSARSETGVSWYQQEPRLSLELIQAFAPAAGGRVIDVGGGASVLVDRLLDLPFAEVAVLDVSEAAMGRARARLGPRGDRVRWISADVTEAPELGTFDVWHDRAVFHFLTDAEDRRRYVEQARKTIPPGGVLVLAAFADDGPKRCSDLDVCHYNARTLAAELADGFALAREAGESHTTPWGASQAFFYGAFRRI